MNCRFLFAAALAFFGCWVAPAADTFVIQNPGEFAKCVDTNQALQKLAGDMAFVEGPVWYRDALVLSDIPNNRLMRWSKASGLETFRSSSQNANGNTVDLQGRLISAEHSGRRLSLTENDGTVKTIVDRFEGKKFNSPNDVVVKSDGSIWFTDPPYGVPKGEKRELDDSNVYRHDPKTGKTTIVVAEKDDRDYGRPNGLCFSPDEKKLYVADSGSPHAIRVFEVTGDTVAPNAKRFCQIDKGSPDGIRCDAEGRIWSSAGDGVHIFAPDGTLIGKILVPEAPANLCFGRSDGKKLFITARKSLYLISVRVTGTRH